MTEIERLASALERYHPGLGFLVYAEMADRIEWCVKDTGVSLTAMASLIEGTQVVVPVDPSNERINVARPILLAFNMEFSRGFRFRHHFKALGIDLPEWAEPFADATTVTKAMCAEMIYRAMTAQQEKK